MRLFLYYASHSFINMVKKLLKTWVSIFLVIMILCGGLGYAIGSMLPSEKSDKKNIKVEDTVKDGEKDDITIAEITVGGEESLMDTLKKHDMDKYQFTDLIVSLAVFLILAMNVAASKNSGNIFQPGDVPMLFASPLRPQSVMLFRLMGQMATTLFMSVFMLFQLPNLMGSAGFSVWGSLALVLAYGLLSVLGTLFQVTFYTITSNMKNSKKSISTFVIIFLAILAGAFLLYRSMASEKNLLVCAIRFFANKNTFLVPFWGWIRGFCYYSLTGDPGRALIFLALFLVGCALLIVFIWKMKADFYEDALQSAEKKAQLIDNAKRASRGGVMQRNKDRSDKLERDGFHFGNGASVFFFKPIYNRLRFGIFKIFSKTSIVFTLVAGVTAWFAREYEGGNPFFIPVIALTVLVFYRTLGNPLQEDTSREFFVLIPDSPFLKMWYSLFGGLVVNALDLALPMIVAEVLLLENPLIVLGWMLFILSVSFFGTAVGTFINVSLPQNAGANIKAMIQILFLYFGMAPSVICVLAGTFMHAQVLALVIGTVVNIGLSTLFCCFTPHFLENH